MAIAVVRANSLLIRGSRDRQRPHRPVISDQHTMNNWRTWSEQYEPYWPLLELNALAAFAGKSRAVPTLHGSNTITEVVVSHMVPIVSLPACFVEDACTISDRLKIWVESAA